MRRGKRHIKRPKFSKARSCDGKQKLSRKDAVGLKVKLGRKYGAKMVAYSCVHGCKLNGNTAWHVGHERTRPV